MDLSVSQLMQLQREQYEAHKDTWNPRVPAEGKSHILYMIEEIGEVIAILKKKGNDPVLEDPAVRAAFLEEMSDVLMYYIDVLLCYDATPQELSQAFTAKHRRNMGRNYTKEYEELYKHGQE